MTKGEKLIWELFLMVRDLTNKIEPTAENTARQTEWARVFHEMEHVDAVPDATRPVAHDDIAEDDPHISELAREPDDEPAEDPHEHGAPPRPIGKRKKK